MRAASGTVILDKDFGMGYQYPVLIEDAEAVVLGSNVRMTVAMAPGQPELRPGMFGRVEIVYDRRADALLVPKDAVLTKLLSPEFGG